MKIILKRNSSEVTVELNYDEFKERIRKGEVFPIDRVQSPPPNNQWWTVDNLRIFHSLSTVGYAKGSHLVAREKADEEDHWWEPMSQMQPAERDALTRKFFRANHSGSDSDIFGLFCFLTACREQPLDDEEFSIRFTYLHSFGQKMFVRASHRGEKWELLYRAGVDWATERLLLADDEAQQIIKLVEGVNLTAMADKNDTQGLDGSTCGLEIARHGTYGFRHRWSPDWNTNERRLAEFVALGKYLVQLSDLQMKGMC